MGDFTKRSLREDLTRESLVVLREKYPALRLWVDRPAMSIYKGIREQQSLTEFIHTVPYSITNNHLKKNFGDTIIVNYDTSPKGKISAIQIKFKDILKNNIEQVNEFMDKFGWIPSHITVNSSLDGKYSEMVSKVINSKNIIVEYLAKYDLPVDVSGLKYLYHLTPDINYRNIDYSGLTPKSGSKLGNHPNRIYLFNNLTDKEIITISGLLFDSNPNKDKISSMFLLKIDLDSIRNHLFFEDPLFLMGDAFWTYENIPPTSITKIKEIKM